MNDVKLKPCEVDVIVPHHSSKFIRAIKDACLNCPNRAPSAIELDLRRMVDALAKQANEEERLKVYNAELVMGRDEVIKELRECLKRAVETRIDDAWLKDARALLKKGQP